MYDLWKMSYYKRCPYCKRETRFIGKEEKGLIRIFCSRCYNDDEVIINRKD